LETCNAILREPLAPLSAHNSEVPVGLQQIVERMLAKSAERRYATAAEICRDLGALAPATPEWMSNTRVMPPRRKGFGRRAVLGGVIALALFTATAVGALTYRHFRAPILNEHDSILLSAFENQTGQPIFDGTVTEAVRQSLEQSSYVHLVPRSQLADAERRM